MAEPMPVTQDPQNTDGSPFEQRSVQIAPPLPPCPGDHAPDLRGGGYLSSRGTWAGSRPDRAAANNAQYGVGGPGVGLDAIIAGPGTPRPYSPPSVDKPMPEIPTDASVDPSFVAANRTRHDRSRGGGEVVP